MGHTTLYDPRNMTEQDADQLMQQVADLEIGIAVKEARAEARVQRIKDQLEEDVAGDRAALRRAQDELRLYILGHPQRFRRPRSRKTAFGAYGMQLSRAKLLLEDKDEITERLQREDSDFVKMQPKLDRQAIIAHLKAGNELPGATLESADRPFVKVSKALIDAAVSSV